jgi:hypothetical protein
MIARYCAADKAVRAGCSVGRVAQNGWNERSEGNRKFDIAPRNAFA